MAEADPSTRDQHHVSDQGRCPCGWEAQPQAFHWFPELGSTVPVLPGNNPLNPPLDLSSSPAA